MNIVFGIIVGIFVLMGLIVAHELGHFIAARRNGVTVKGSVFVSRLAPLPGLRIQKPKNGNAYHAKIGKNPKMD